LIGQSQCITVKKADPLNICRLFASSVTICMRRHACAPCDTLTIGSA